MQNLLRIRIFNAYVVLTYTGRFALNCSANISSQEICIKPNSMSNTMKHSAHRLMTMIIIPKELMVWEDQQPCAYLLY